MTAVLEVPRVAEPMGAEEKLHTYEEIAAISDPILRELHDGKIVEMPSPHTNHQFLCRLLLKFIERWIDAGNSGLLYLQPCDLKISSYRTLIPDLMFYRENDRKQIENESGNYLQVAPDLAVEIVSPSSIQTDKVYKLRVYGEIGVRFYWIIDPFDRVFIAYRLGERGFEVEGSFSDGDVFAPEIFPGLQISLDELFAPLGPPPATEENLR